MWLTSGQLLIFFPDVGNNKDMTESVLVTSCRLILLIQKKMQLKSLWAAFRCDLMFNGIRNSTEHLLLHSKANISSMDDGQAVQQLGSCILLWSLPLDSFFFPAFFQPKPNPNQCPGLKLTLMPFRCALLDLMLAPIRMDPLPPQGGNPINDSTREIREITT